MSRHCLKIIGLVLALGVSLPGRAAEVTVFAAASLTDSLKEIGANYGSNSTDHIQFNFGASSTLARQIQEGAPADIFFPADEAKMDSLEAKGLVESGTRRSRLGNALVVVVVAASPLIIRFAADLTNASVEKIALADPAAVPAGIYARKWLEKSGLWSTLQPKVVPTQNVRGALAAVESGNVDAGVVFRTDAGTSRKVKIAYAVPAADAPDISYPVALIKTSPAPASARKFLTYLESPAAAKVFVKYGFGIRN
ncbi:MAG TPA: molybdate ABC transporter substrate-binding protein [Candidatus Acidoferrum sp.]|jgi:molybdate transport system substrate-binding protein|nr:molybdate ABC transporter substrate-binding protein [Candidatus Acidoferrum sp.]